MMHGNETRKHLKKRFKAFQTYHEVTTPVNLLNKILGNIVCFNFTHSETTQFEQSFYIYFASYPLVRTGKGQGGWNIRDYMYTKKEFRL